MEPYYKNDRVTLYHGDCREIVPSLGKFDLLLTDPPYGIGIASNPVRQKHEKLDWDAMPVLDWVLYMLIEKCNISIIWGGNYFNLPPHQCFLAWDKIQPENFSLAMLEQAWTNIKSPAKMFRKSVLSYEKNHPTQKPVELMAWCINFSGNETKSILDPFCGSGTTGVAAMKMGRSAVLIEREEKYCEIAARRLEREAEQPNLFGAEGENAG